jgi:apolipoprotein N-acyltransferase
MLLLLRTLVPYAVAVLSGGFIALATLVDVWWLQALSFVAIAPALVMGFKSKRPYNIGLAFFAGWVLPTTLWFYSFMNPFVAVAASVGWVFLLANLFWIFSIKKLPLWSKLLMFCIIWAGWTFVRLRLPVVEDWWLPHLGYAVWRNAGVLQLAQFGGEMVVEFVILLANSAIALLWASSKRKSAVVVGIVSVTLALGANFLTARLPEQDFSGIVAVQSTGDFEQIKAETEQALHQDAATVIWPENHLSNDDAAKAVDFAKTAKINLVINTTDDENHNVVEIYNANGERVLQNLKYHIAPDEYHESGWSNNASDDLTAFICYDVHYTDIVSRVGNT